MQTDSLLPIEQKQRIVIIDILRGWALLGVVLMNYADHFYLGLDWSVYKPDTLTDILLWVSNIIFSAKSWTMLSVLFGYGFSVLMENVAAKGINPTLFFSRRMFWLFILALINSAFYFGDILKDYAVMGMVILVFRKCSARTSLIISLSLLIAVPGVAALVNSMHSPGGMDLINPHFYLFESSNPFKVFWFGLYGTYLYEILSPGYLITVHVVMLSCFFFGMAAQKAGFFIHLQENRKYVKRIFWISLAAVLAMIALFMLTQRLKWNWLKYYNPFYFIILASMLFIASTLCWLFINGKLKAFFRSMQVIGKMTLSNYITQNMIALLLFSGIGLSLSLKNRIHFGYYLLFALIIYVAQVFISKWWLKRYQFGPIEWAWRQLSYAKKLPNRKQEVVESVPV
jgi:uncharacterized protein